MVIAYNKAGPRRGVMAKGGWGGGAIVGIMMVTRFREAIRNVPGDGEQIGHRQQKVIQELIRSGEGLTLAKVN